jgi:hypothetical protein
VAGIVERLIETWRSSEGFGEALTETWTHMRLGRFVAVILCVTILFGAYFTFSRTGSGDGQGCDRLAILQAAPSGRWRDRPID